MRNKVLGSGQGASAFPTAKLQVPGWAFGSPTVLLVLEADVIRRHAARDAHLHFPLVQPALIGGLDVDVGGTAHLVVELELLREAIVGLTDGAGFAEAGEGGGGGQGRVAVHEVGDHAGRRAGFAHCARIGGGGCWFRVRESCGGV